MSPGPTTLGTHMKRRRLELEIGFLAAVAASGVSKSTWANWEKDRNIPEEINFQRIERILRWAPGSVAAILAGGEPTEIAEATVTTLPLPGGELPPDDDFVRELRATPGLSTDYLNALIRSYWADRALEQQRIEDKFRGIARQAGAGG